MLIVCDYLMHAELRDVELQRLRFSADLVVCCVSLMLQRELTLYYQNEAAIQKVKYEVLQQREEFMKKMVSDSIQVKMDQPQSMLSRQILSNFQYLGINEIDQFEKQFLPIFVLFLNELTFIDDRIAYLRRQAKNGLFGYGAFTLLQFIARLCAISADLKYVASRFVQQVVEPVKTDNWSMGNNSVEDIGQQLQL